MAESGPDVGARVTDYAQPSRQVCPKEDLLQAAKASVEKRQGTENGTRAQKRPERFIDRKSVELDFTILLMFVVCLFVFAWATRRLIIPFV